MTNQHWVVVADTTFASVDMGAIVVARIGRHRRAAEIYVSRVTVPGFKDLAAAARRAINDGAELVVACGMPGPEPIDEACAHAASHGLQLVQALTGVHVLEVFVHMSEAHRRDGALDEPRLVELTLRRCEGHADNAVAMVLEPASLTALAGNGRRQGGDHAGPIAAPPGS